MAGGIAAFAAGPAMAQRQIDDPRLSPMLFGETEKERRDKVRQEREEQEEALRISQEQDRDAEQIDDPKMRPLLFGPSARDDIERDPVGARISLGEEDNDRGFFGALTLLVPEETNLSVGVGPVYEPDYFGSDDYEFNADPQAYVKFRNFVFLDDDGADFAVFGFSGFRVGPSLRIRGRRREGENIALQGLGDVGTTFEFGGFIGTTFLDRFSIRAKARHGIKTGHRGTIIDGFLTALLFRAGPVSVSASGQASWIGDRFADAYFSVTPEQSIASGGALSVYDADAGFRDVGGSINAYINVLDRWSVNPYVQYNYIFDDYANTPIIADFGDRNQVRVGFHLIREFTFGGNDN
ncbi:MAG: MipA/OmpV family protein [Pseudomonadota bacterium]